MSELSKSKHTISAEEASLRWDQSLALISTFTEIWLDNPQLARQAGRRVQEFVMPLAEVQRLHAGDLT